MHTIPSGNARGFRFFALPLWRMIVNTRVSPVMRYVDVIRLCARVRVHVCSLRLYVCRCVRVRMCVCIRVCVCWRAHIPSPMRVNE